MDTKHSAAPNEPPDQGPDDAGCWRCGTPADVGMGACPLCTSAAPSPPADWVERRRRWVELGPRWAREHARRGWIVLAGTIVAVLLVHWLST